MLESTRHVQFEDLRYQAMLYAAGEMESTAADAFETRLGTDAHAQQALVQAVQMAGLIDGRSYAPDPTYRDAVRSSVLAERRPRRRQRATRLWLSGTCAAVIGILAIWSPWQREPADSTPRAEFVQANPPINEPTPSAPDATAPRPKAQLTARPQAGEPDKAIQPAESEDALGAAETWAELTNYDRLRKVLEFELRRKLRMRLHPDDLRIQGHLPSSETVVQ